MKRDWKPGDVAASPYGPVFLTKKGWIFDDASGYVAVGEPISGGPRPLVVIDPEDAATLDALGKAWDEAESCDLDNEQPMTMRALRMRVALRSLLAPPKPDEPTGLGAVVEDSEGRRYTRYHATGKTLEPQPWAMEVDDDGVEIRFAYCDIDAVRVLSEGVTP